MDILADRFEWYWVMSKVFFKRLTKEEKIDAMLEVIYTLHHSKELDES